MIPRFRPDAARQRAVGAARLPAGADNDWILAAVHHDDVGLAAWQRIRDGVDLARLPDGHARLAPLVYETLSQAKVDEPLVAEFAKTRLVRWALVRLLVDAVSAVVADLIAEGIDVMVLKGAALADVYPAPAQRPMVDIDLLIRPADLPRAVEVLARHGMTCPYDVLAPVQTACVHSAPFVPPNGGGVDLHWMASPQLAPSGVARAQWRRPWYLELDDDEFWERSRPVDLGGVEVRSPSMTDLLLLVVLHGVRFGVADDTRWAVDAATILRQRGDEIDWDLFAEQAVRRGVGAVTATALGHLVDHVLVGPLAGSVPDDVVPRLRSGRRSWRERVIDGLSRREHGMEPGAPRLVVDVVIRHLVLTANEPLFATLRSFPWFVALWLGVERPRHIPGFLRRGTWRERLV